MEAIRSWALSVTAAAIISAVISLISPSGALEKTVKTIIALFVLLSFLAPLTKTFRSDLFSVDVEHINEWIEENKLKKEIESETISVLKSEIVSKISSYINENINAKSEVDAEISISENYDIVIERISIGLDKVNDTSGIQRYVEEEFDIIPEIYFITED